ncbi:MAG: hypothetical protein ACRC7O_12860 [Fimbriiglobus sp.]
MAQTIVWNLRGPAGETAGQAATFPAWEFLEGRAE